MKEEAIACSLSGPELLERIKEWREVASRATSRQIQGDRIVATYPPDRQLVQQLHGLIAAEAECCSFMRFEVHEGPDQVVVELQVPEDMSEVLATMLGLVAPETAPA